MIKAILNELFGDYMFEVNYNSDNFFTDSESEEVQEELAKIRKVGSQQMTQTEQKSDEKFEYWNVLPSELQEKVLDGLDFDTWINFMLCGEDGSGNHNFPKWPLNIVRFSFKSDIIQGKSREMEHIRIRMNDKLGPLKIKITENDGYCKFAWNWNNKNYGSVNIAKCGYLKVTEKFMRMFYDHPCKHFKIVVEKNKTDPTVQSVSKLPYFNTFLKKTIGLGIDGRKVVDDQYIIDKLKPKIGSLVLESKHSSGLCDEDLLSNKIVTTTLSLPNLDAEKVMSSLKMTETEIEAQRAPYGPVGDDVKLVYGYHLVTHINQNTIKYQGAVAACEYHYILHGVLMQY